MIPKVANAEKKALTDALIAGSRSSATGFNNGGLAYFDGVTASMQAKAKRADDNNCSPIVKL